MEGDLDRVEALDWVLAKLAAAKKPAVAAPKAPVYKAPEFKPGATAFGTLSEAEKKKLRDKELALWKTWKEGGMKAKDFEPLYKSHSNIINKKLNAFKGAEVNRTAQKAFLIENYRNALESYDPNHAKGASLATHIYNNLRRGQRFVIKHQNPARITEPLAAKIGPYKAAISELTDKLGYEPTHDQVVEHSLSWEKPLSKRDVLQLSKQVRRSYDINAGGSEIEGAGTRTHDPFLHAAHIIYPMLKPHEQKVHAIMFPKDGRAPIYKTGAIATKLKWHVSKVSKARTVIIDKIQNYVGD